LALRSSPPAVDFVRDGGGVTINLLDEDEEVDETGFGFVGVVVTVLLLDAFSAARAAAAAASSSDFGATASVY